MMPLGLLSSFELAEVLEVKAANRVVAACSAPEKAARTCQDRVEDMGLRVGKVVEVLSNEGRGPLLLKIDESRIAMGRGMAMKIMVRRIEK